MWSSGRRSLDATGIWNWATEVGKGTRIHKNSYMVLVGTVLRWVQGQRRRCGVSCSCVVGEGIRKEDRGRRVPEPENTILRVISLRA